MKNLIYDRTQNDIINNTPKGNYDYNDLNRIENWCEYLANILNEYSYKVNVNVKTNWIINDIPTLIEMERIRNNIKNLKEVYYSFTNVPENLKLMDIHKANDIEKILNEIDIFILKMIDEFRKCGTFSCNETEGLI